MTAAPAHFFLLPHQDDEFGVFHLIESVVMRGHRPVCIFLTDGGFDGADPSVRDAESRRVLAALGVAEFDMHFLGSRHGVSDGRLVTRLPEMLSHLKSIGAPFGLPEAICVPAWEGGHQDHDAAHALGLVVAHVLGVPARLRQFPLYNADRCRVRPYRVLEPLAQNGPVESIRIPAARRAWYLRLCLDYRSQKKSMAGLMPFIAAHYALRGTQDVQKVNPARLRERPHQGRLFYERFRGAAFGQFRTQLDGFLTATLSPQA